MPIAAGTGVNGWEDRGGKAGLASNVDSLANSGPSELVSGNGAQGLSFLSTLQVN